MNNSKRTLSLLLSALIMASVVSCSDDVPAASDTASADTTAPVTEAARDNLDPTLDFNEETVTLIVDNEMYITDFTAEQTGDIVDDALYQRTLDVEVRLNVKLDFFWSQG